MKKLYYALFGAVFAAMLTLGVVSLVDVDATHSAVDNKELAKKPAFSFSALFDGSYISQFERYYSDTFPMRDALLKASKLLNRIYYYSGNQEQTLLILDGTTGAELGGESLEAVEQTPEPVQPQMPDEELPQTPTAEQQEPVEQTPEPPAEPEETPKPEQPTQLPSNEEVSWAGNVIVVGNRAMEIPNANESVIDSYAAAIGNLSQAMGEDVRTISLVVPNGGEFYSPESMHTGIHSQKDMIARCYDAMDASIVTVDAYSALSAHRDEYIYFRTDHHWTQLGAYYAYTALCEAAGFEAAALDSFETGVYENFVGSMYTFTKGYPQSQTLLDNPDTLTYYLPTVETHAQYYADATLQNGVPISVVYTKLPETASNKYLCFIGGDTPICVIETQAEGGVCMVLKESYGNALVPFLTSHYSKIIVIDPREFNREGKPALDLTSFASQQQIDDLLVVNYPYMINNSSYIRWLNRLVGADS